MSDYRQQQELQEEAEQLLVEILAKVKECLSEDEMSLLRWAAGITVKENHAVD